MPTGKLLGAIGVLIGMALISASALSSTWEARELRREWPEFAGPYSRGRALLEVGEPRLALRLLQEAVAAVDPVSGIEPRFLADAHSLIAEAHVRLWETMDAEAALRRASEFATPRTRRLLQGRLRDVQRTIILRERERHDEETYFASPGLGPAGYLNGRVVVVYVFIDDGRMSRWSTRTRRAALENLTRVEGWYRDRAGEWGVDGLSFVHRVFVYDRDPHLRNAFHPLVGGDVRIGYDLVARMVELRGAGSVNRFLRRIAREEAADQAVLMLHVRHTTRSYALRCTYVCWSDSEYAFLFEGDERNDWSGTAHAQAHEGLHLFGADDLYNIGGTDTFAARDIMNHARHDVAGYRVDSITAYAVGWTHRKPDAPFPIEDAGVPTPGARK